MFSKNHYFVNQIQKESLFWTSAAFDYEITDPESKAGLVRTREPKLSLLTKLCRMDRRYRGHTPFDLSLVAADGAPIVSMKRGVSIMLSTIQIFDENRTPIGSLKQKFSPVHAKLEMFDPTGKLLFTIKGDWADWDFRVVGEDGDLATISKGSGESLLTEMLTTKDSYHLKIGEEVPAQSPLRRLIVASAIAVDIACNE